MKTKLLSPGPVTLSERVSRALLRGELCHRESEFAELTKRVLANLAAVYPEAREAYRPVLLTTSGTGAVEAMIGSLVPKKGGNVLVIANGVYGERAASTLEVQGKRFELLRSEWLLPIDISEAEERLRTGRFSHVVAVHHETTTGRLNDIDSLGRLCRQFQVPLLLDAVSSFGGEAIDWGAWSLEACAASAGKCLHAVPGISFVMVKKDVLARRESGATSMYLDLFRYAADQADGFSPFTQGVQAVCALDEALLELFEMGGWEQRRATYRTLTEQVRIGLRDLGISPLLEDHPASSSMLASYWLPRGLSYEKLHAHLKARGFVIYSGQGRFEGEIFRIAVMGDLTKGDLERLLAEIRSVVLP